MRKLSSHWPGTDTGDGRRNKRVTLRWWLVLQAFAAAAVLSAPTANATPDDYFSALDSQGMITWDYPGVLKQGYIVCDMLRNDINPIGWLTSYVGYDMNSAASIIASARVGLCPDNYVSQPQLQYAI